MSRLAAAVFVAMGVGLAASWPGAWPLFAIATAAFTSASVRFASQRSLAPLSALSDSLGRIADDEPDASLHEAGEWLEHAELHASVTRLIDRMHHQRDELASANERLTAKNMELQAANEVLSQLSITDGLTKLHNHRHFQDLLQTEVRRAQRTGEPLSMVLLDLDDFKQLNDQHGHAAGDDALAWVARVLSDNVRDTDLLARYGGEEFVVLCVDTDLEGAVTLAEKIRLAIDQTGFGVEGVLNTIPVSVSAGVAQYRGDRRSFFGAADRALYRAKAQGKNCVIAEEEASPT